MRVCPVPNQPKAGRKKSASWALENYAAPCASPTANPPPWLLEARSVIAGLHLQLNSSYRPALCALRLKVARCLL